MVGGVRLLLWSKVFMCGLLVLVVLVRGLLLACGRGRGDEIVHFGQGRF